MSHRRKADGRAARRRSWIALVIPAVVLAAAVAWAAGPRRAGERMLARGQYLVTIMDCAGCHTPGALTGKPDPARRLAGSEVGFGMGGPTDGVVYPKNLTPDRETGLGGWTDEEIVRAVRQGQGRDGRALVPIMPWPAYAALSVADARAIVAYLRSVPAVRFEPPANVKPGERATKPYLSVFDPSR
jgi:mono/diheme cytochrome c family protein